MNFITKSRPKVDAAKDEILALARKHHVTYQPTSLDAVGDAITRLSGDDVQLDDTQHLLLALYRAGVIDKAQSAQLRRRYVAAKYE